jgi:D-glycero-D-manno-heptose 1,7-bisphosphate phosphatase
MINQKITYPRPALFLDRDGVINIEKNYVHLIEDFEFNEGIFDLCRVALKKNMPIVVVTNQSGIGRGYYSEEQFHILTDWMKERFEEMGAPITAVYYCPDHPEFGIGHYKKDSFNRKPNPGMILRARDDLNLDLSRSMLIGDKLSDIIAAKNAGIGFSLQICSNILDIDSKNCILSLAQAYSLFLEHYNLSEIKNIGYKIIPHNTKKSRI